MQVSGVNFFIPMCYSGLMWHQEMEHGIFLRSQVHNVSKFQFLLSHFFVQSILTAFSNLLFLFVIVNIFGFEWGFNLITTYFLIYLQANHSILLGQMIAVITNSQLGILVVIIGISFPNFFTCGLFWPVNDQYWFIRVINTYFPLAMPTNAYRGILLKNYDITHPNVYNGFVILFVYIILILITALFFLRRSKLHYD